MLGSAGAPGVHPVSAPGEPVEGSQNCLWGSIYPLASPLAEWLGVAAQA